MKPVKFSTDIVIIDLEASCKTFGANVIAESNIIEIGAVKLNKKSLEIVDVFSQLIQPADYPVLPQIADITGITQDMLSDKPLFDKVMNQFIQWYGNRNKSILAGWGLYYDLPLLRKECERFGIDYGKSFVGGGLDVKSLAYLWLAKNQRSTTGIAIERVLDRMSLETDFEFHRALDDAKATALILKKVAEEYN